MRCPFCDHADTQVMETRVSDEGDSIRRRRRCPNCDKRFTTYERVELSLPTVVKSNGTRAEFDRRKVRGSMALALRKRPVSSEAIDAAMHRIEDKLLGLGLREVPSAKIGELVMRELQKLDKVAYVRFASVYRSFEDVDEFAEAIREVRPARASEKGAGD
jgi:transcriptional repressor NrdR